MPDDCSRPFLLGSASWPKSDQERRFCMHACPYMSCFPLWNSVELTTGIPWQSGQKLFSFLQGFSGYAFASFFSFYPFCVPVHLA